MGEVNDEGRAAPGRRSHAHLTAVGVHDGGDDCQAQAVATAVAPAARGIGPVEPLKDPTGLDRGDTRAEVAHLERGTTGDAADRGGAGEDRRRGREGVTTAFGTHTTRPASVAACGGW